MVLRALRVHGFKSFADPVEIQFPGRVVGIIGPNGCGKSNIVDAVRFVLGEQSLRLLRARKIDDLIFAGNVRRPATGMGEVGMVLDNSTRWLDIEYPEIEIRRVIHRDGESKYFLNGTGVRLKDIQKMFMDVGVNKGHYSVIGQGQVQMIVSASPEERRQYFEEAAGVVSYRQSKKETLRRLDEVQKNIDQAGVFAAEYESRMHGLKVQAGRAQKYLEYQTAYRQLYLFSAWRRFTGIRDELAGINEKIGGVQKEQEQLEKSVSDAAGREESLAQDRQRLSADLADKESALRAAELERAEKDKSLAAAEEKIYSLRRNLNENDMSLLKLSRSFAQLAAESGDASIPLGAAIEQMKKTMASAMDRAQIEQEQIHTELAAIENRLHAEERRMDIDRADIISAHETLAALESTLTALSSSAEEIRGRIEKLTARIVADESRATDVRRELELQSERRAECGNAQTVSELAAKEAEKRLEQSRGRLGGLRKDMAEAEGRWRALGAAEDAYQGFSSSVRMVLERFNKRNEFLGVVRDLIAFDAGYAKAVEAALGPKLQHLVVETGETVKEILGEIGHNLRGRVTFWSLDLLPPPLAAQDFSAREDMVGWAVNLIRFDEKLRRLFENLLGRTLVVKSMDALLSMAKSVRGISIVTLDGAYYRAGAITAGPTTGALLISRKQDLMDTESRVKELVDLIAAEEETHQRICSEIAATRAAAEAAYRRYKETDANHARLDATLESMNKAAEDNRQLMSIESEQLTQKMNALAAAQARQSELRGSDDGFDADVCHLIEDLRRQSQAMRAQLECADTGLRTLQDRQRDLLRIEDVHGDAWSRHGNLQTEIQDAEGSIQRLRCGLAEAGEGARASGELLKACQAELAGVAGEIETARSQAAHTFDRLQKLRDEIHALELRSTALNAERANLRENVMNELQTDIEAMPAAECPDAPSMEDVSAEACVAQLRELQLKMQKLGTVNVNAIDEYNEVSAKHGEMAKQMEDLNHARENLKEILRKTDRICKERFTEVFHRVAEHFQDVTKKLFLGGEGKLILTESADLLESGVDIQLRPPGKGFTSIASRSGGEQSLAGLCLLFALFMEKPSPFCMLDEVDAALDDANVGRLARLIEEFSAKIQFVIVTHNKLTMQAASCLFGATMEEAGITRLISVKMKNAQEAAMAAAS